MTHFLGINIIESPLATQTKHFVERHPIRKRRRNWRVVKRQVPACFRLADGTMLLHPTLMAELRKSASSSVMTEGTSK